MSNQPVTASQTTTNTDALPVSECWALLRQGVIGRLAVVVDGEPDIFPINYAVDHGTIVFRSDAGRKLRGAVGLPVAFEIDGYELKDIAAWSVVIRGEATEIRDTDESIAAMDLPTYPWQDGAKAHYVRIVPSVTTGRRVHVRVTAPAKT